MSDVYEGRNAAILQATIDGTPYTDPPQSRIEELLLELKAVIEAGGGGGGTTNYNGLSNKPQINSVTLQGNKSLNDLGINIPTVDAALDGTSENPVQNKIIKGALDGKQAELTFDSTPTAGSNNPVTSGGVKTALDSKQDTLTFDNAPTENSNNPVKSGGVYTALEGKQDELTFDTTPTASSTNPVTSGGIKTALNAKQDTLTAGSGITINEENVISATGGSGTSDYSDLTNKPQINNVTLSGNKSLSDLGAQAELTFDSTPTAGSNNPVTSGGVKTAIDAVDDKLYSSIAGIAQNDKGSMELYSKNLNNIVTSGFYNAMTCTNGPFSYAALIVCGYYLTGYCFQMAVDIQTGEVKTRVQTAGTWGAWSESNNIIHG